VKNLGQMLKQAQEMQARLAEMQAELARQEHVGAAGGGMVQVTLDGKGALKRLKIDPSLLSPGEAEIVEDLTVAAHADARAKIEANAADAMGKLTGGLQLPPGFKLPF
jgi:DNA-binding YbaB/EbfC family protein